MQTLALLLFCIILNLASCSAERQELVIENEKRDSLYHLLGRQLDTLRQYRYEIDTSYAGQMERWEAKFGTTENYYGKKWQRYYEQKLDKVDAAILKKELARGVIEAETDIYKDNRRRFWDKL